MEVKIIRGYKLKLWKDRLSLAPDFINQLDLIGFNLVHSEFPIGDKITVIVFVKMRGRKSPIPAVLRLTEDELEAISERVNIDYAYDVENRSN